MNNQFLTTKESIIEWLDKYGVRKYTLIPNDKYGFKVNVKGLVNLSNKRLTSIPIKFGRIEGTFWCHINHLTSLEFCPSSVVGDFSCQKNELTTLKNSPKSVGGDFVCFGNQLTSLKFCPQKVGGVFYCYTNNLIDLEFFPQSVGKEFNCNANEKLGDIQKITDFKEIYKLHLATKSYKKLNSKLSSKMDNGKKIKI